MIKSAISLEAHAKINLHLEVLGKRKDGFHNIVSVFSPVSLADELLMQRMPDKKVCEVLSPLAELPVENTITKTYEEFKNFTGISDGVSVRILKKIPEGAGLGGGSSDAAAVLLGLNDMFSAGLRKEDLKTIALKIGSDVPFFLENGAAIVKGRGEEIKRVSLSSNYFGILLYPEIKSSTPKAYSLLGRSESDIVDSAFNPELFCGKDCREWPFFNSFEDVLFVEYPEIKKAKLDLLTYGADFALMSGAGSSVFGLFKDEKTVKNAYLKLFTEYPICFFFLLLAF
ncbi:MULTISPECIES: 4-(cytidine 5'-diphospho)-2-C-methyl-D-erythritol kinase [unclassified Treponema]|uniref:4-(cytidine 5'-diphospho)-2-C-methyl-D-erythritol kinase n=1 Tax=unclassified Treponema TaxID=2638727 RepID=UPI0020A2FB57|nr:MULTISPECIES: 4-(cytidine 5'-diphospho)-2-C-methyl-D-erythritol kinase [unclassified Treponema]UTC67791.1 4-(cytidine 5'-diphospho)-2-C-methyl-D-erythritol kinase [Treponema sp. OMZ 789]UTC70516.1 4-(cytidine 5'-diphospho)-2-C-methyl-D-erythritol kinase [Treponema sp. OMZ 790]UTC73228.1 4-(cytidine 5'-diphospho)-2-C-methyl-D-erythritol kinase [Treponema sp. OMZ 791]